MTTAQNSFVKDPDGVLDYAWDWSDWLAQGETITAHTVTIVGLDSALHIESDTQVGGVITVWLSGGTDYIGYAVTCHVATSAGRQDDRTLYIACRDR